jgi:ADP-heptose:LPS heptosyltransferase
MPRAAREARKIHGISILSTLYYRRMKKAKVFGNALSFLSSLLPGPARLSLLSWLVKRRHKAPGIDLPYAFSTPPKLLVILPEDPLAALHLVSGCAALAGHFRDARITVVCHRLVTPFFRMLTAVNDFIEYDCSQRYLFSREFSRIGKAVSDGHFDACVMGDRSPHMALLYLCGQSAAPVRIGYDGAGKYPFLNLTIRPSPKRTYSTDQGLLLATMLGAPLQKKIRWTVAKEAIAEVNLLLGEMKVEASSRLIGIDAGYFFRKFGAHWTQSLIDTLRDRLGTQRACYLFSYEEPEEKAAEWLGRQTIPVFLNLPASRCAALVCKSEFIVAGATVLFELADVLHRPLVGILTELQFEAYCRESETTKAFRYADGKRPDQGIIDDVGQHIAAAQARPAIVP